MAYLTPKGHGCPNPIPLEPVSEILKIRLRGTSAAETRGIAEAFPDLPLRFRSSDGSVYLSREDLGVLRSGGLGCEIERTIEIDRIPVRFLTSQTTALWPPPPSSARMAVLSRLLADGSPLGRVAVRYHGRGRSIPHNAFSLDRSGGSRGYVWEIMGPDVIEQSPVATEPDRYPALRGLLSDPDARVVLALGSGGLSSSPMDRPFASWKVLAAAIGSTRCGDPAQVRWQGYCFVTGSRPKLSNKPDTTSMGADSS